MWNQYTRVKQCIGWLRFGKWSLGTSSKSSTLSNDIVSAGESWTVFPSAPISSLWNSKQMNWFMTCHPRNETEKKEQRMRWTKISTAKVTLLSMFSEARKRWSVRFRRWAWFWQTRRRLLPPSYFAICDFMLFFS